MKVIAVTQARFGSTRLPGKVLKKVGSESLLSIHIKRALKARKIDELVVATTTEMESEAIQQIASDAGCRVYKGSLNDVLDRFYNAVKESGADYVVRLTSDCPLVDPELIDEAIDVCINGGYDYCSNTVNATYPDGMDVEVFRFSALEKAWQDATSATDREHVTSYIWRNSSLKGNQLFTAYDLRYTSDLSAIRLTVDEQADFELVHTLILQLGTNEKWKVYADHVLNNKALVDLNSHIKRNEGFIDER